MNTQIEKSSTYLIAVVEYTTSVSCARGIAVPSSNRTTKIEENKNHEQTDSPKEEDNTLYYMIRDYATSRGIKLNLHQSARYGQFASEYCRANGISTGRVPNSRFRSIKTYPKQVLDKIFETHNKEEL
jgi:hypothetical protein